MDSVQYLKGLLNFYSKIAQFPLVHLVTVDNGNNVQIRVNRRTEFVLPYNLGFKIGMASWISNKLIQKNIKILEEILAPTNDNLLITVQPKPGKCIVRMVNRFGDCLKKHKIVYLTLNLFPYDFK